jgi:hypothetical protein
MSGQLAVSPSLLLPPPMLQVEPVVRVPTRHKDEGRMLSLLVLVQLVVVVDLGHGHVIWTSPPARQNIGILRPQCNLPKVSCLYHLCPGGSKRLTGSMNGGGGVRDPPVSRWQ